MPASLSALVFLVMVCGSPAASAEETALADAYANGLRAFERGDPAAALQLWAPLAEQGDPRAQFGLGLIHEEGLGGLPRDEKAALGWYQRAARFGLSPAQNNLALMHAEGRGVPRDPALAVKLWRQAAAAGFGPAQHNLALALASGSGVGRNEREAAEWNQRASAQRLLAAKIGRLEPGREEPSAGAGDGDDRPQRESAPIAIVRSEARSLPATSSTPPALPLAAAFYVQLASLRSHEDADRFGQELSRLHPDLLAKWQPTVRTVDLGGKGVWHRVLFGPIQGRKHAAALCEQMQTRGDACLVTLAPSEEGPR